MTAPPVRVLVIDDEPPIRRLLRTSLTANGYIVEEAGTGRDGEAQVLRSRPDVIVLDLGLPDMNGQDLIRRLREEGFRIAVPAFVSNPNQRRLLPHADFVKIDVRDLDVEGPPVVHLARSYGALLVAEYVESPDTLRHARDLGFTLFQGNLLERAGVLDRAGARRVSL